MTDEPGQVSVWDKFDVDAYLGWQADARAANAEATASAPETKWQRRRFKAKFIVADFVAAIGWVYAICKVFVGDVDRWVVENVSPSLIWIVDFRFFIVLTAVTVLALVLRRWTAALWFAYFMFWPLIFVFFKVPRFFYKRRSWTLVIGAFQLIWASARSVRFSIFLFSATAFSLLVLAIGRGTWLLYGVVVVSVACWSALLVRAAVSAPRPSRFVGAQQRMLCTLLDSKAVSGFTMPDQAMVSTVVDKYDKTQSDAVIQRASVGVIVYGTGHAWAKELERYRRSGFAILFTGLSVVVLVLQALFFFTLANLALHAADPDQFATDGEPPGVSAFARYTFSAISTGEIDAVQARGGIATFLSIYAGMSAAVLVLVLVVAVIFGVRQSREDEASRRAVEKIRERSDAFAKRFSEEYAEPVEKTIYRLIELSGLIQWWLRFAGDAIGSVRGFEQVEWRKAD